MQNPAPVEKNKDESFFDWAFFTLFLPLVPVLVKIIVYFFGKQDGKQIDILDSTELLYYSFIVSIVIIYNISQKDNIAIVERIIRSAAFLVALISIAMIVMVYVDYQRSTWIRWASIIVTVLMIVAACINKRRKGGE